MPAVLFRQQPLLREPYRTYKNCWRLKSRFHPLIFAPFLIFLSFRGVVNGLEVQRAYTPITPVNAEGFFEVLIKVNRCLCSIN